MQLEGHFTQITKIHIYLKVLSLVDHLHRDCLTGTLFLEKDVDVFSCHCGRALGMAVSTAVGQTNISQQIWQIAMKFCTDIHSPQKMTPTDFGDHLTFPLVPY